jgi:ferrous iron transport protein B
MELPAYHMPQVKSTWIHLWNKFKHYLSRVTTIIAGAVVVIWFLSSFNFKLQMVEDNGESIIGIISKGITWLFIPLGFGMGENGWKFVVAAFTGLIAKEMVVATLGVYSGMDDALDTDTGDLAGSSLALMLATLSAPAAIAFMAFNLLSVPCMAAVAAASGEIKSRKKMWGTIGYWLGASYIVSALIYWIGKYGGSVNRFRTYAALLTFTYFKNKRVNTIFKPCKLERKRLRRRSCNQ